MADPSNNFLYSCRLIGKNTLKMLPELQKIIENKLLINLLVFN